MKKYVFTALLLFISIALFSQNAPNGNLGALPTLNGKIFYTGMDSVSSIDKNELYNRAKTFLSKVFPNFKDVIKLDDRELGKIVVRGLFNTQPKGGIIVSYIDFLATTTILVKDGKFKYEISDFVHPTGSYSLPYIDLEQMMFNKRSTEKRSTAINDVVSAYVVSLNNAMKSGKEEW